VAETLPTRKSQSKSHEMKACWQVQEIPMRMKIRTFLAELKDLFSQHRKEIGAVSKSD
jgi:hypothetical protein